MNTITNELILDVRGRSTLKYIYANQGDRNSRFIRVTLVAGNQKIEFAPRDTAKIRALLPNGNTARATGVINSDGTITVELTDEILGQHGNVRADIAVYGLLGGVLSSEVFCIKVRDAQVN